MATKTRRAKNRRVIMKLKDGTPVEVVMRPVNPHRHKTHEQPELVQEALPDLTPAQAHHLARRNRERTDKRAMPA